MKQMKKFLLMLLVVAAPLAIATSCSDDDDDEVFVLNEVAAGTYKGEFTALEVAKGDIEVTVAKVAGKEDEVNITIGKITVGEGDAKMEITLSAINNVKLTGTKANAITIASQDAKTNITGITTDGSAASADLKISGTLTNKKTLKLTAASFKVSEDASLIPGIDTTIEKLSVAVEAEK